MSRCREATWLVPAGAGLHSCGTAPDWTAPQGRCTGLRSFDTGRAARRRPDVPSLLASPRLLAGGPVAAPACVFPASAPHGQGSAQGDGTPYQNSFYPNTREK
ncbi:hypothetical protein GCM10009551_007410 [Nocardiopsis tropica]